MKQDQIKDLSILINFLRRKEERNYSCDSIQQVTDEYILLKHRERDEEISRENNWIFNKLFNTIMI